MTSEHLDYSLAFLAGLLASGHCIGMCGGLASSVFMRLGKNAQKPLPHIAYQGARISVYALVGLVAGGLGTVIVSMGGIGAMQGVLQLLIGVIVILIGLSIVGLLPVDLPAPRLPASILGKGLKASAENGPVTGAMLAGALNGLVPCPLTFAVAIKATTAGGSMEGALLMLVFGLGTVPSMIFISTVFGMLGVRARGLLLYGAAASVMIMGVATAWQGLKYFNIMRGLA